MSPEVLVKTEAVSVEDEYIPELPPSIEVCEKVGYIALCASCPLIAQFGGCPKQIRAEVGVHSDPPEYDDSFLQIDSIEAGALNDFITFEAEDMTFENIEEESAPTATPPKAEAIPTETEPTPQPHPSQVENDEPPQEAKRQSRTYLDLLFNDSIEVVLAPQVTGGKTPRIKKREEVATEPSEPMIETLQPAAQAVSTQESISEVPIVQKEEVVPEEAPAIFQEKLPLKTFIPIFDEIPEKPVECEETVEEKIPEPQVIKQETITISASSIEIPHQKPIAKRVHKAILPVAVTPPPITLNNELVIEEKTKQPQPEISEQGVEPLKIALEVPAVEQAEPEMTLEVAATEDFCQLAEEPLPIEETLEMRSVLCETLESEPAQTNINTPIQTPEILTPALTIFSGVRTWALSTLLGSIALFKIISK